MVTDWSAIDKANLILVSVLYFQFITFKDGKIGVNFGGYHAEAGLGGLLTGNAAHGGLSASAGTPFGQRAGAGVGGSVDGGKTLSFSRLGAYAQDGLGNYRDYRINNWNGQ